MTPRETLVPLLVTGIGGGAVLAVLFLSSAPAEPPVRPEVRPPASALMIPLRDDSTRGWTVVGMISAQRALVVEVDTLRLNEAVAIAQQIVEPVSDRYDEVLVYFFDDPGATPRLAALRVQWTPADGYRTLELTRPE
jgi:hypothetical protein